jgi:hypothetical protein
MLPVEGVRQEIREGFRLVHRCYALLERTSSLRHRDRRNVSRKLDAWVAYGRVGRYGPPRLYRAYRVSELVFATSCCRSQGGRDRPHLNHRRHQGELEEGASRPTLGMASIRSI